MVKGVDHNVKLWHITLKLVTVRVISLAVFRPTGLCPIAVMDISQERQSDPIQYSPSDCLPHISFMQSPFNHLSFCSRHNFHLEVAT